MPGEDLYASHRGYLDLGRYPYHGGGPLYLLHHELRQRDLALENLGL